MLFTALTVSLGTDLLNFAHMCEAKFRQEPAPGFKLFFSTDDLIVKNEK